MTINEILNLLEENYEEIDVFDHIKEWSTEISLDYRTFALCTFVNEKHNIVIQTMVYYPPTDETALEDCPIYETYIGYTENPNNIIHKAFRHKENTPFIDYNIYSTLDVDMGWINKEIEENNNEIEEA